jgi:hypothetical protein
MPQARGSQTQLALYGEWPYGTPGPSGYMLRFTQNQLQKKQNLIDSNTITSHRTVPEPMLGNVDVSGSVTMELSHQIPAKLFYFALGAISTSGSVASIAATGAGSATTVNIAAPPAGGVQATATIADGVVTITEPGSGYIAVPAVTLDVGTAVATVAFTHTITLDNSLPPGLTFETDYGATLSGLGRYVRYTGCRIASLDLDYPTEGPVILTVNMVGRQATPASSPHDPLLTDYGHTPFSVFSATIKEGGTTSAVVQSAKVTIANDLDTSSYTIAGDGLRGELPEGLCKVSGTLTALFSNTTLMDKALAQTESSLQFILQRGTGDGTQGNEFVKVALNQIKYEPVTPPISGPKGIVITLNFHGYRSQAGVVPVSVVFKNRIPQAPLL